MKSGNKTVGTSASQGGVPEGIVLIWASGGSELATERIDGGETDTHSEEGWGEEGREGPGPAARGGGRRAKRVGDVDGGPAAWWGAVEQRCVEKGRCAMRGGYVGCGMWRRAVERTRITDLDEDVR